MSVLPVGISGEAGEYQIERSLRFNSADSAYLSKSFASAGNRKTWTWSGWVKRSGLGSRQCIFGLAPGSSNNTNLFIEFQSNDKLAIDAFNLLWRETTQVFRDTSAWYHFVFAIDTTQATGNNRIRLYVNGAEITAFSTTNNPTQNDDLGVNQASAHFIGQVASSLYYSGYLAEVHFIDGSALDPTSFGETDSDTGVWKPKAYSGSYGTNGFYLDFGDNSSTTALGYDAAGSNDWTPNNFSVTAGAGNDSLVDTPTRYGTDTGAGGEVRGNYATLNPLALNPSTTASTLTNGNLDASASAANTMRKGTIAITSGKWYMEATLGSTVQGFGLGEAAVNAFGTNSSTAGSRTYYLYNTAALYTILSSGVTNVGSTVGSGGTFAVAVDMDAKKLWLGYAASGGGSITWVGGGSPASGTTPTETLASDVAELFPLALTNGPTLSCNFGARAFAYTAPSGFKALCTTNLPEPTIADGGEYFNAVLYTGNGGNLSVTGVGFQPDLVWGKIRSTSSYHRLQDVLRGSDNTLATNVTDAEVAGNGLVSFDADGFTMDAGTNINQVYPYVAWNWKANGAGVSNTDGTISSTVSANTTAGFSIVTYTGTGSGTPTVGHGLGVAPSMIFIKSRSNTINWGVGHASAGWSNAALLNATNSFGGSSYFASTAPTSTVFSIQDTSVTNISGATYVAYCFSAIAGYSAFGSYTGNGNADGPFVYTGFRPRWIMFKKSSAADDWIIYDSVRDTYNVASKNLYANGSFAEDTNTTNRAADILSNGFKIRSSATYLNASGATFIYAAFAENPTKFALAR